MKKKYRFSNGKLRVFGAFILLIMATAFAEINKPEDALEKLVNGNKRFTSNQREFPNQDQQRLQQTASEGQFPYATIVACSDSRVPVEHIFDAGIGELFVIRIAGNVVDINEAGSIEYGVEHLHTPVLVVLGHTNCGAVTAVCRGDEVHGNIPKLVDNIVPAVEKSKKTHGNEFGQELLDESIRNNIWQSIEDLLTLSPISCDLIKEGKLKVVGALYHLDSGEVEWLGEHPELSELLAGAKSH